jgi:hypothetical protein
MGIKENRTVRQPSCFFLPTKVKVLGGNAGAGRADIGAGSTVLAQSRVNHVHSVDLRNRAFGAFWFAGTALDAVIGNFVSHGLLFLS